MTTTTYSPPSSFLPLPWLGDADPLLIGLVGRAGSGKTAAAEHINAEYDFECAAFADSIKNLLFDQFNTRRVDYARLYEPSLKHQPIDEFYGLSPRQLMQRLGDWGRNISVNYWVDQLAHDLGLHSPFRLEQTPVHDRICISDVRYPNEAQWIRERGGVLIHISRPGGPLQAATADPAAQHSSETHADELPVHFAIVNDGLTLTSLHARLDNVMHNIGVERRSEGAIARHYPLSGER